MKILIKIIKFWSVNMNTCLYSLCSALKLYILFLIIFVIINCHSNWIDSKLKIDMEFNRGYDRIACLPLLFKLWIVKSSAVW